MDNTGRREVAQLSAASGALLRTVSIAPYGACGLIAVDPTSVWVASARCHALGLTRVDAATGQVVARIPMDFSFAYGVVSAFGSVWVTVGLSLVDRDEPRALVRIDPASNRIVGYLPLPRGFPFITAAAGSLWIHAAGSVLRIQPQP